MIDVLPKLLKRGGFRIRQWLSDRKRVIEAVPESERVKRLQELNWQALPVERIPYRGPVGRQHRCVYFCSERDEPFLDEKRDARSGLLSLWSYGIRNPFYHQRAEAGSGFGEKEDRMGRPTRWRDFEEVEGLIDGAERHSTDSNRQMHQASGIQTRL